MSILNKKLFKKHSPNRVKTTYSETVSVGLIFDLAGNS